MLLHLQEQAHFRLPKPIDGLHGITDAEQRTTVTLTPACGQQFKQSSLRNGSILKLINQNMVQMFIQRERHVCRMFRCTQCLQRTQRHFNIVNLAACLKFQHQFTDRPG